MQLLLKVCTYDWLASCAHVVASAALETQVWVYPLQGGTSLVVHVPAALLGVDTDNSAVVEL